MRATLLVAVATASVLAGAPAVVFAHEGHASCRAAGQFTASMSRESGRAHGEFSSELARLGLRDDFVAGLHEALCEPHEVTGP
jgi:hypothetical protein